MELERSCTLYIHSSRTVPPSFAELQKKIESINDATKAEGMQDLIIAMCQGEAFARLLMPVLRYAMPSNDKRVKKLTQLYLEIVGKCNPDGTLKEEMILVCNALRNDLMSPNEYVRGSTLRLLSKIHHFKVLEPLIEAVLKNLTHRHCYVRRNAVMCTYSIVKHFGMDVMPTAADQIEQLLLTESDLTTKRNAFLFLVECSTKRAIQYVLQQQQQQTSDISAGGGVWSGSGDIFQLVLLQLLRKVCRQKQQQKGGLLKLIVNLLPNAPAAVAYEGACALLSLSRSPLCIRAAAGALTLLLCGNSDNNVKLIVLDRLQDCVSRSTKAAMHDFVIDLLRGLQTPSLQVRRKTLDLVLQVVEASEIQQLVNVLKSELIRTSEPSLLTVPGTMEYRRLLTKALHFCCSRFPEAAQGVMNVLMDFLSDADASTATEIAVLVRELVCTYTELRENIVSRLLDAFPDLSHARVLRVCLWILGEYSEGPELMPAALTAIYNACSPLPFCNEEVDEMRGSGEESDKGLVRSLEGSSSSNKQQGPRMKLITRTVVLPDGTYGTEDVFESVDEKFDAAAGGSAAATRNSSTCQSAETTSALRKLIVRGDFLLAVVVAVSSTKLVLHSSDELSHISLIKESADRSDENSVLQKKPQKVATAVDAANGGGADVSLSTLNKVELSIEQKVRTLYLVACLLRFVRAHPAGGSDCDAALRITQCLRALFSLLDSRDNEKWFALHWRHHGRETLRRVLEAGPQSDDVFTWTCAARDTIENDQVVVPVSPDDLFFFRQLREDRLSTSLAPVVNKGEPTPPSLLLGTRGGLGDSSAAAAEDYYYYSAEGAAAAAAEQQQQDETAAAGDETAADLELAVGGGGLGGRQAAADEAALFQLRLAKVQSMTGQADPVYVEAFLHVNQFDLVVELLLINRTNETLQNVAVELSTHGDLKLVDRPAPLVLAAGAQAVLHAFIKVRSTEAGIVFGYLMYNRKGSVERECLTLNELHVDLLDYIERRWIGQLAFRSMWAEFEWENKIHINTSFTDVSDFLEHLMRQTNLTVVGMKPPSSSTLVAGGIMSKTSAGKQRSATTGAADLFAFASSTTAEGVDDEDAYLRAVRKMPMLRKLSQDSSFFAVNLYSKSMFGEDALVNVSIEKLAGGKLAGSIRIRSRTQGIALSLGDRITVIQRSVGHS